MTTDVTAVAALRPSKRDFDLSPMHRSARGSASEDRCVSAQQMTTVVRGRVLTLTLPSPDASLRSGGVWGRFDEFFTPAFWRGQAWQHQLAGRYSENRLGRTLREEIAACLLGGFGMPAALGLAAYDRLRQRGLLEPGTSETTLRQALLEPLTVDRALRRYRFPVQKARHLAAALSAFETFIPPDDDRRLRDALTFLPGVGQKTASWIVRNHRASNQVAIIDVHILRAGRLAGVFPPSLEPAKHYAELERRFLAFANDIGAPASVLDALIWDYMRLMPDLVHERSNADNGNTPRAKPAGRPQPV